ncbi:MAG: membrane dipeptidase [Armatimonadetes bacterium]|nr:membrane dipeptidase [Armatimonadota bacterium]
MNPVSASDARRLHREAIVVDAAVTLLDDPHRLAAQLPEAGEAGLTVALITVGSQDDLANTVRNIASWHPALEQHGDRIRLATRAKDIDDAKAEGRCAIVFHFQNTRPFEGDTRLVRVFKDLGVRVVGLTYNERNLVGDGCTEPTDVGLSEFGRELIRELNRHGVLVDLSHVGDRTSREAIEASDAPVVFTHSNARSVCHHPRNIPDEHITLVAKKGGMVGINVFPAFVKRDGPTLENVLDHVDHVVRLAGVDHVGFGLDLNTGGSVEMFYRLKFKPEFYPLPPWKFPEGISRLSEWPNLTEGLLRRGYGRDDVLKILGGNFLRVVRRVWQ